MSTRRIVAIGLVMTFVLLAGAGSAFGQPRTWVLSTGGSWSDACGWSFPTPTCDPASVPNTAGETASIGIPAVGTVGFGASTYTIGGLAIGNSLTTLDIPGGGGRLETYGPNLANEGKIQFSQCFFGCTVWPSLNFLSDTTISGAGIIKSADSGGNGVIASAPGVNVVNSAGHTIMGKVTVSAKMDNLGYIVAQTGGMLLTLDTYPKTNSGTITAQNGGEVRINYITIDNYGGLIFADGGPINVFSTSTTPFRINGGTLQTTPGALISLNGTNVVTGYLDGVHNLADCQVNGGIRVAGSGVLANDATITVSEGAGYGLLFFQDASSLAGSGQIILNAGTDHARIDTASGYTLIHPSTHTIRGLGRIDAAMTNEGLISADFTSNPIELYTKPKTNNALMQSVGGGRLDLYVPITQSPTGTILADGNVPSQSLVDIRNTASVTGGTLSSQNGAKIRLLGGTIADLINQGIIETSGFTGLLAGSSITNNGAINMLSTGRLKAISNVVVSGSGAINMNSGTELQSDPGFTLANEAGHTIRGVGSITASMINRGAIVADVSGFGILLTTNPKANDGVCKATNSGYINVSVDVSGSGAWIADNGTLRLAATGVDLATTGDISVINSGKLYSYLNAGSDATLLTASNLIMDSTATIGVSGVNPVMTLSGNLDFAMTDEAKWIWDTDATLTMTGGVGGDCQSAQWTTLEVGGQDKGAPLVNGGYSSNFDLSKLVLGTGAHVTLVDARNNGNRGATGKEALYADMLTLGAGAVLNLNGFKLFVNGVQIQTGSYFGGQVVNVLLCCGSLGDMNCDAIVDLPDVAPFVQALLDQAAYQVAFPSCCIGNADMNGDGAVNGLDTRPFLTALGL